MKKVFKFVKGSKKDIGDTPTPLTRQSSLPTSSSHDSLNGYHVDIYGADKGMNKLHKAAYQGNMDKLKLHLKTTDIDVVDEFNRTALHFAITQRHTNIVWYLLNNKAKMDIMDKDGFTPFHKAVQCGNTDCTHLMLERGAEIDSVDDNGNTALHLAARQGYFNIAALLLKKGADLSIFNNQGEVPLHIATLGEHKELVNLLLNYGAHVNVPDRLQRTPLMLGARVGNIQLIHVFLQHGSNLDICDSNGWTASDYALIGGHQDIAKQLSMIPRSKSMSSTDKLDVLDTIGEDSEQSDHETSLDPSINNENEPTQDQLEISVISKKETSLTDSPLSCVTPPPLKPPRSWDLIQSGMIDIQTSNIGENNQKRKSLTTLGSLESRRDSFIEQNNNTTTTNNNNINNTNIKIINNIIETNENNMINLIDNKKQEEEEEEEQSKQNIIEETSIIIKDKINKREENNINKTIIKEQIKPIEIININNTILKDQSNNKEKNNKIIIIDEIKPIETNNNNNKAIIKEQIKPVEGTNINKAITDEINNIEANNNGIIKNKANNIEVINTIIDDDINNNSTSSSTSSPSSNSSSILNDLSNNILVNQINKIYKEQQEQTRQQQQLKEQKEGSKNIQNIKENIENLNKGIENKTISDDINEEIKNINVKNIKSKFEIKTDNNNLGNINKINNNIKKIKDVNKNISSTNEIGNEILNNNKSIEQNKIENEILNNNKSIEQNEIENDILSNKKPIEKFEIRNDNLKIDNNEMLKNENEMKLIKNENLIYDDNNTNLEKDTINTNTYTSYEDTNTENDNYLNLILYKNNNYININNEKDEIQLFIIRKNLKEHEKNMKIIENNKIHLNDKENDKITNQNNEQDIVHDKLKEKINLQPNILKERETINSNNINENKLDNELNQIINIEQEKDIHSNQNLKEQTVMNSNIKEIKNNFEDKKKYEILQPIDIPNDESINTQTINILNQPINILKENIINPIENIKEQSTNENIITKEIININLSNKKSNNIENTKENTSNLETIEDINKTNNTQSILNIIPSPTDSQDLINKQDINKHIHLCNNIKTERNTNMNETINKTDNISNEICSSCINSINVPCDLINKSCDYLINNIDQVLEHINSNDIIKQNEILEIHLNNEFKCNTNEDIIQIENKKQNNTEIIKDIQESDTQQEANNKSTDISKQDKQFEAVENKILMKNLDDFIKTDVELLDFTNDYFQYKGSNINEEEEMCDAFLDKNNEDMINKIKHLPRHKSVDLSDDSMPYIASPKIKDVPGPSVYLFDDLPFDFPLPPSNLLEDTSSLSLDGESLPLPPDDLLKDRRGSQCSIESMVDEEELVVNVCCAGGTVVIEKQLECIEEEETVSEISYCKEPGYKQLEEESSQDGNITPTNEDTYCATPTNEDLYCATPTNEEFYCVTPTKDDTYFDNYITPTHDDNYQAPTHENVENYSTNNNEDNRTYTNINCNINNSKHIQKPNKDYEIDIHFDDSESLEQCYVVVTERETEIEEIPNDDGDWGKKNDKNECIQGDYELHSVIDENNYVVQLNMNAQCSGGVSHPCGGDLNSINHFEQENVVTRDSTNYRDNMYNLNEQKDVARIQDQLACYDKAIEELSNDPFYNGSQDVNKNKKQFGDNKIHDMIDDDLKCLSNQLLSDKHRIYHELCSSGESLSGDLDKIDDKKRKLLVSMTNIDLADEESADEQDPPFWASGGHFSCVRQDTVIFNERKSNSSTPLHRESRQDDSISSTTSSDPSDKTSPKHLKSTNSILRETTLERGRLEEAVGVLRSRVEVLEYQLADANQTLAQRADTVLSLEETVGKHEKTIAHHLGLINTLSYQNQNYQTEINHLTSLYTKDQNIDRVTSLEAMNANLKKKIDSLHAQVNSLSEENIVLHEFIANIDSEESKAINIATSFKLMKKQNLNQSASTSSSCDIPQDIYDDILQLKLNLEKEIMLRKKLEEEYSIELGRKLQELELKHCDELKKQEQILRKEKILKLDNELRHKKELDLERQILLHEITKLKNDIKNKDLIISKLEIKINQNEQNKRENRKQLIENINQETQSNN